MAGADIVRHDLRRGTVYQARAEEVYDLLPARPTLVISDGPYNMRKADWDKFRTWDDFVDWYRPHVEAWTRVCAEAASVYVWGTDDSASELRPLMREHGWTKRVRVTWDRGNPAGLIFAESHGSWGDATEVCDFYTRATQFFDSVGGSSNVWRLGHVGWGSERLRTGRVGVALSGNTAWREPLHPCQKPLAFYDRIIRASSRPGDLVLEPFGGTLRAAVACERLPEDEARRYVCVEPDARYVEAALASMGHGELPHEGPDLFGGVK